MKHLFLNLILMTVLFAVFSQLDYSMVFSSLAPSPTPTVTPTATPTPTPTLAPPVQLLIPKLSINTIIEPVSVNAENVMEVPDGWDKAGWYTKAVKPGEIGTAVIVGHYDDQFGAPAIFYYLKNLQTGDQVLITNASGKQLVFSVTEKTNAPFYTSINDLLINDNNKNLILITCAGWWNAATHNYSERLIVRAVSEN
jgi:sortase A